MQAAQAEVELGAVARAQVLVAGEPAMLNVTALRREETPVQTPDASRPLLDTSETLAGTDVAAVADAAITAANQTAASQTPAQPVATKPAVQSKPGIAAAQPAANPPVVQPAATGGAAIQIGIFSVEGNANRAITTLAKAGISATIRKETSHGKPLWSVIASGDAALLAQIKKAGFKDAYFIKR